MNVVFHELELLVEGIVPHDFDIIDCKTVLFVPVQVFAHEESISEIHFDGWDVLVDHFDRRLVVAERGHLVPQLCDLKHHLSKCKRCLLVFNLLQILGDRLDQICRLRYFKRIEGLHKILSIYHRAYLFLTFNSNIAYQFQLCTEIMKEEGDSDLIIHVSCSASRNKENNTDY